MMKKDIVCIIRCAIFPLIIFVRVLREADTKDNNIIDTLIRATSTAKGILLKRGTVLLKGETHFDSKGTGIKALGTEHELSFYCGEGECYYERNETML